MSSAIAAADPTLHRQLEKAELLHRKAVHENANGHAARGEQLIRRGLQTLAADGGRHDPRQCSPDRCRTTSRLLATLAKSAVEIHGVEPALAIMQNSIEWSGCLGDPALTAFLISQRALILFRGGRLDAAEVDFDDAISMMPEAGVDLVRVLLNRGALQVERGAVHSARIDLTRALELAHSLEFRQAERIALHNLGCLEHTVGDLPRALRLMHDGMELDGETQQGIAHLDRSRVLLAAGLPDEADAALAEAAELFRRDRCWQDLAEVDLTRAEVALLTDRVADARRLASRARDRFRRHGNDRWRRTAELVLLHADRAAGRPAGRLLPQARRLATEFAEAGLATQTRTVLLLAAELELELDRVEETDMLLDRVGRVHDTDPIAVRLHTRLVHAASLERRGAARQARRTIARGLQDLAAYQAQFGGIDLQSASAVHGRRLAQHDLHLALRAARPDSVVAAVERSRAVSGRIRPVTPPADERTAELLTELRRAVEAGSSVSGSATREAALARQRAAELQSELRSLAWLNSGSRAWQPPTAVRELRAAATEDRCQLVTITEVEGRLGAVVIAPGGPMRLVELADAETVRSWQRRLSADLDALANAALPAPMATAVTRSLRHGADELGELFAPAFADSDREVVISPTSGLLTLPWSLLPRLAGRPVTVTPSLSGWHRGRATLSGHPTKATSAAWSLAAAAGPGLLRAKEESSTVVSTWNGQAETRDLPSATPAELLDAMAASRLVHVAAHGEHRGENPMFSSLSLTGGPLFAYELDQRTNVPEHVVLSACDVGRSTARAGEETLGLTTVLLQLGTACVLAGVARVHDDAAAEMMGRYHAGLARGLGAAEALCLVGSQVDTPSPFVCFGTTWRA